MALGVAYKKLTDEDEQSDPVRNEETSLWECPQCKQNDFAELSEVSGINRPCQLQQIGTTNCPWC